MKILSGLFRIARKRTQTKDGAEDFKERLSALVDERESLSDEGIEKKVEELKAMTADLPDSEDKEKLTRFLEDFKAVKSQDEATAKEAVDMVANLYELLDASAMSDTPTETAETATEETVATEETSDEDTTEEKKKEETADEDGSEETEKSTKDEGEEAEEKRYTISEIVGLLQSLKDVKDACNDEGGSEEQKTEETADEDGSEETEKEKEEVTSDHAPIVGIVLNGNKSNGSLSAMFANLKKGGR
jgi:hypothetical protein